VNITRPSGPNDEPSDLAGDSTFIGVDERETCPPGYVNGARNYRFRNGRAAPREGITLLPWMQTNGRTPFTEVYGGFVWNNPDQGGQWIIIAADGGVWKTRPFGVATAVPLPAGVVLTRDTFRKFVQAGGGIVLLRGLETDSLVLEDLTTGFIEPPERNTWDVVFDAATNRVQLVQHNLLIGDALRFTALPTLPAAITAGQTYYVKASANADEFTISEEPGGTQTTWNTSDTDSSTYTARVEVLDGAESLPPAEDGVWEANRLWLVVGKDIARASDLGDFLRFPVVEQTFRINEGDSHTLRALYPFNEDTLVAFKTGAVRKATGIDDLETARGPLNVTQAYGAASPSIADQGADLHWLNSELRVTSLRLTELNKEQGTNIALSDPLVQTFARINSTYADRSRLTIHDGYLRVALPLDDAELLSTTELVTGGTYADGVTPVTITGLTAGKIYKLTQGANDGRLVNGTEILYGDATFTAQGTTVDLYLDDTLTESASVTASLVQVLAQGVNTGIAVFDFQNNAWCGTDEGENVVCVVDWLKFNYGGQERLGFIGADGWLHLCDDGFEDETLQPLDAPYVDVLLDRYDQVGDAFETVRVNGGTEVILSAGTAINSSLEWAMLDNAAEARENMWGADAALAGGYNPTGIAPWTCPNTTPEQIVDGVRFTATNGALPEVKINGTIVTDGSSDWAFVDSHTSPEIGSVPIVQYLKTRRYAAHADMQRFSTLALLVATWSPQFTLRTRNQGEGSLRVSQNNEDVTRDRLKYFQHDTEDWDPTNANDDYHNPGREDYSFAMTDEGIEFGAGEGVGFDAHQEYVVRAQVDDRGAWCQAEIENADGRLELVATAMESEKGEVLSGFQLN